MRVLFTGGGTGGHIYPALALAAAIDKEDKSAILFVGTARGLERELVPRAGYQLKTITVSGLERKLSLKTFWTFANLAMGMWQSYRILKKFRPDVVVGTGGYVSVPVVYVAARFGYPTLIHEQNVLPGLANRILSRYARVTALAFRESEKYFSRPKKLVVTGNPVREEILGLSSGEGRKRLGLPEDKPLLLVFGGSRGARPLNEAMVEALPKLRDSLEIIIYYVTGEQDFPFVREKIGEGIGCDEMGNIIIKPYLHDMPAGLAAADLVVSRAGATTLAELTAKGVPAILVPSPHVAGNHQEYNARLLEREGAAQVIKEEELTGDRLTGLIVQLMGDERARKVMAARCRSLGQPDAGEKLLAVIRAIAD